MKKNMIEKTENNKILNLNKKTLVTESIVLIK